MRNRNTATILSLGLTSQWLNHTTALPSSDCPILGPTFPQNFNLANTKAFQDATSAFPNLIDELFASGAVNETISTFYIDVFSTRTNDSIYHFSHVAPGYPGALTAGKLDEDTVFRTGSVSKLVTMYAILARAGNLEILGHPVTWYLPELRGNEGGDALEKIVWEDITVGALAAQMGGTGSFPVLEALCLSLGSGGCSVAGFLDTARNVKRPVTLPFETALYSDMGWGVLGRVLERLANMTYDEALQAALGEPLGLNHVSSFEPKGNSVNGFVMPGDASRSSWGQDNQITAPSGGVYSSAADLRKLGLSILHSELLDPTDTRAWLKPHAHTSSLTFSFGAPWEIYRLDLPVSPGSNITRVSDLYTKAGGNAGYGSIFGLSPDHGMGFSINVGGDGALSDRWRLRDLTVETIMPTAEYAAAENARANFVGVFAANSSMPGTNMTLSVDDDKPGIGIESLYLNNIDSLNLLAGDLSFLPTKLSVRLYPTGLVSSGPLAGNSTGQVERYSFRSVETELPTVPPVAALGGTGLLNNRCGGTFLTADSPTVPETGYGADDFVLEVVGGRLERLQSVAAQIWFSRVE